tara:strand:- start:255 stop:884 length:630 start_codon:yes stop_codon:yes gene_type:complete
MLTAMDVFQRGAVIPVMVIKNIRHAVPLAKALLQGGIKTLEITLRSEVALEAITQLRDAFPEALIGAGTVTTPRQLEHCIEAGAAFALSPGATPALLDAGQKVDIPFIPAVSSASDIMLGMEYGYQCFKFFPAEASGGILALKAFSGPFPEVRFCPTGGLHQNNFTSYLSLENVLCIGGSWVLPELLIQQENWEEITNLCLMVRELIKN